LLLYFDETCAVAAIQLLEAAARSGRNRNAGTRRDVVIGENVMRLWRSWLRGVGNLHRSR
jgi:hypothetical protein